jgi:hypothetical protein
MCYVQNSEYWRICMIPGNPPQTVDGIVLLGWKAEAEALKFLMDHCVFDEPLGQDAARVIWQQYHSAVESLPERAALAPPRLPMTGYYELEAVKEFKRKWRGVPNILGVVKIDPMGLVVHQLKIVVERSHTTYRSKVDSMNGWLKHGLFGDEATPSLNIRAAMNAVDVELPHAEFVLGFNPGRGFTIEQMARHVNVTEFGNRMMLWAGYQRSYARMLSMAPDAIDRSLVVALTADGNFKVSPLSPNQGEREMLTGLRPPLFGDFFDDRLVMKVKLRKKKFELHVRAALVEIDA